MTHAHEDHIGAVPDLLKRFDLPVWGSAYTIAFLRLRLEQREMPAADLRLLPASPEQVSVGPFGVEAITVAHSVPQSRAIALHTPRGVILHTADFKLDSAPPDGEGTDCRRLRELGRTGLLALCSDSTNASRPGRTPSEATVSAGLDELLGRTTGRVVLTTFASNLQRLAELGRLCERHGRRLALLGAAVHRHVEVAEQLGLLSIRPGVRVAAEKVAALPRNTVLVVASGSQGEPRSAMARLATEKHRDLMLEPGDTVIHSARIIPGNEKPIGRMINRLLRQGVQVITANDAPIHVSGHASAEELTELIEWVRPQRFIPIHGEYRQLKAHRQLAIEAGLDPAQIQLAESGDLLRLTAEGIEVAGHVPVGRTLMEVGGVEVAWELIRDRRKSAKDGVVVAIVDLNRPGVTESGYAEIVTRGFTPETADEGEMIELAREAIHRALSAAPAKEFAEPDALESRIEQELRRFIRRQTQRHPLIIARVLRG